MKTFLAAPFTQYLTNGLTEIDAAQKFLTEIINSLESAQIDVFSAHRREDWGARLDEPHVALRLDLEDIAQSDLMIAFVGSPSSPGVQLEIGYAIAKNIPILLLVKKGEFVPYLNRGLSYVFDASVFEYGDNHQAIKAIQKYVSNRAGKK